MPGITGDEMVEYAQLYKLNLFTLEQEKRFWELDSKLQTSVTKAYGNSAPNEQVVTQHMAEPVHITVTRNAKFDIQFEVSIHGATVEETLRDVNLAEQALSKMYPKREVT